MIWRDLVCPQCSQRVAVLGDGLAECPYCKAICVTPDEELAWAALEQKAGVAGGTDAAARESAEAVMEQDKDMLGKLARDDEARKMVEEILQDIAAGNL